ncbi:hypothetical protein BH11ACT6_BH11ACT6_15350 [soil metagenome]
MGTTRRMIAVGAFAVAAVAAPLYAAVSTPEATSTQAECLAWLGSKGDGVCIGNSLGTQGPSLNGTGIGTGNAGAGGIGVGTPGVGIGNGGFYTSPLLPGTSVNVPLA